MRISDNCRVQTKRNWQDRPQSGIHIAITCRCLRRVLQPSRPEQIHRRNHMRWAMVCTVQATK